jgi:hypothetical protein
MQRTSISDWQRLPVSFLNDSSHDKQHRNDKCGANYQNENFRCAYSEHY